MGVVTSSCPSLSLTELSYKENCALFLFSGWRGLGRESQKYPWLAVQSLVDYDRNSTVMQAV